DQCRPRHTDRVVGRRSEESPLTARIRRRHTPPRCRRCKRMAEPVVRIRLPPAESRTNSRTRLRLQNKPASGHAIPPPTVASVCRRDSVWSLPGTRMKNKRPHLVHLSPQAMAIIDQLPRIKGDLVFTTTGTTVVSGFSNAKHKLDTAMRVELGKLDRVFVP